MFIARILVTGLAISMVSAASAQKTLTTGDFNGDGKADLAIGVPFEDLGTIGDAGVVHVLYGRGVGLSEINDDIWHQNKPGILDAPEFGDHFGQALAAGDFNGDGHDDLAIGTNEDGVGSVQVIFGSPNGLVSLNNQVWTQATTGGPDSAADNFGSVLAAGDFNGDGFDDLAIGEAGDAVFNIQDAGSVTVIYGSPGGPGDGIQRWHQYSSGIADVSEPGDAFGTSLAVGDFDADGFDDLAIGVPREDFGTVVDAGAVHVIYGSASGLAATGNQFWNQNSSGIADLRESGDTFGQTLAAGDFNGDGRADLAIGVPFEKIDATVHAGAVHVLYGRPVGLKANNNQFWHQNRGGITERCDENDEFGGVLATGDFDGNGQDDLAIGIRSEALQHNEVASAGAVAVLYGTAADGLTTTSSQFWHLDLDDIEGEAENARFGSALAAGDFDNDGFADLAGAAPTEDLDAVTGAGAVHVLFGTDARLTATGSQWWNQNVPGIADECEASDAFGGTP